MDNVFIPFPFGSQAEELIIYSERTIIDIEEAEKMLSTYSSKSKFADSQWLIDKANEDQNITDKRRTISFFEIENQDNCNDLKLSALMRLMKRQSTRVAAHAVLVVREFLNSISDNTKAFSEVNAEDILSYNNYLFNSGKTTSLKNRLGKWFLVKDFFKTMNYQEQFSIMDKYITEQFPDKRRVEEKLIPEKVAEKLDVEFLKDGVPLPFKAIYWTLRLLPNRIHEVLSMKMNCVKQLDKEYFMVSIPTFKQTGPYSLGSIKLIEIKYNGIGQYYIDLLKEFIQQRKQEEFSSDDDFLFYSYRYYLIKGQDGNYRYTCSKTPYTAITLDRVNYFFKHFCISRNVLLEDGTPYSVTSHQFRHNATSDRINSGIFRSIDVQGLTYHHSTSMIEQTYTHQDKKAMTEAAPVVFRGRIINTDNERKINQLLSKPYAKNIYKLGICSDVRSCDKDKSQCLRCEYMIPDVDDLDYYKHELQDWMKKRDAANHIGNVIFVELCDDWIEAYQIVIDKVLSALTNEDVTITGGAHDENAE